MRESDGQAWRQRIGEKGDGLSAPEAPAIASGHDPLDRWLDGGFKRGHLHELFGEQAEGAGSAAGFAAMLGLLACEAGGTLLWLRTAKAEQRSGALYMPGFAELGGDPSQLLAIRARDDLALLRAAADALRSPGFVAVVIECWGRPRPLDLTATRRLTLAAARSGVTALLLRIEAAPGPSTAETRWSVAAAPSSPLEANAPGRPAFDLDLLRHRSGRAGKSWRLEWDRDRRRFAAPALPGAVVPVPAGREAVRERVAASG